MWFLRKLNITWDKFKWGFNTKILHKCRKSSEMTPVHQTVTESLHFLGKV